MCWTPEASVIVTVTGAVATLAARRRGEPAGIWATLGWFTLMEGLQVAGYAVVDRCGTGPNTAVTMLSYLHIALQPFFINAFALALVPAALARRVRRTVFGLSALACVVMLAKLLPGPGTCAPGSALCGPSWCTVSGTWHIGWEVPYNGLTRWIDDALGTSIAFPEYMLASFVLPLAYGAWRFVIVSFLAGPVLASMLTSDPNEMPAVWCLFSIAILLVALAPPLRRGVSARTWWGSPVSAD